MQSFLRQAGIALATAVTMIALIAGGFWIKSHPISTSGMMPVATLVSIGALAYGARKKS